MNNSLIFFVQLLIAYGIPLFILMWLIRQVRQAKAERREILKRVTQIEATLAQRFPVPE